MRKSASPHTTSNTDHLNNFLTWMTDVGIHYNPNQIQLRADPSPVYSTGISLAVTALVDIPQGSQLATIPKSACISTSSNLYLHPIIQKEQLSGGLALVVSLMYELSLGPNSAWAPYLSAMPSTDGEYLPQFWSHHELALLRGTEIEIIVDKDLQLMKEDYETHVQPMFAKYPHLFDCSKNNNKDDSDTTTSSPWSFKAFQVAASLVASRAFGMDDEHGDAMMPLADAFNHKVSIVELAPEYAINGVYSEDEDEDGSDGGEEEGGDEEEEDAEEEEKEEKAGDASDHKEEEKGHCGDEECTHHHLTTSLKSVSQLPHAHASSFKGSHLGITTANGLHLRLQMGIVETDEHSLEIVAASDITAGSEIYNTYGELGNSELVHKYGFCLPDNPFTVVCLDKMGVVELVEEWWRDKKGKKGDVAERRIQLLRDETRILHSLRKAEEDEEDGDDDDNGDEEPFQVMVNGHISFPLFVALRILLVGDDTIVETVADVLKIEGAIDDIGEAAASDQEEEYQQKDYPHAVALESHFPPASSSASPEYHSSGYTKLLTGSMYKVLGKAIEKRLQRYTHKEDEDDESRLRRVEMKLKDNAATALESNDDGVEVKRQHLGAMRAALLLRITEKQVLKDALEIANQHI
jgi:N-lysine methyltransferase SETD6